MAPFIFTCTCWMNILASVSMYFILLSPIYAYGDSGDGCFNESVNSCGSCIYFSDVDMNGIIVSYVIF